MAGINKVILVGNLGSKPELKYTQSGVPFVSFSVATTEYGGKDESGQKKEHTEWHRITAWRKLAEICGQYLDKGSKIYCEGKLRTDKWTDQNGVVKYSTKVIMEDMVMLSPKGSREFVANEPEMDAPDYSPQNRGSFPGAAEDVGGQDDDLDGNFL